MGKIIRSRAIAEEALRRSQAEDHGAVNHWLMRQFREMER